MIALKNIPSGKSIAQKKERDTIAGIHWALNKTYRSSRTIQGNDFIIKPTPNHIITDLPMPTDEEIHEILNPIVTIPKSYYLPSADYLRKNFEEMKKDLTPYELSMLKPQNDEIEEKDIVDKTINGKCQVCKKALQSEKLITPFKFLGLGAVHRSCAERYMDIGHKEQCDVCKYRYDDEVKRNPFVEWLRTPSRIADRRNFIADMISFSMLLPLISVSCWLCLYYNRLLRTKLDYHRWPAVSLLILGGFQMIIFSAWCVVAIRYHYKIYNDWCCTNSVIKVIGWSQIIESMTTLPRRRKVKAVTLQNGIVTTTLFSPVKNVANSEAVYDKQMREFEFLKQKDLSCYGLSAHHAAKRLLLIDEPIVPISVQRYNLNDPNTKVPEPYIPSTYPASA